jgi:hypothetical protein
LLCDTAPLLWSATRSMSCGTAFRCNDTVLLCVDTARVNVNTVLVPAIASRISCEREVRGGIIVPGLTLVTTRKEIGMSSYGGYGGYSGYGSYGTNYNPTNTTAMVRG